MHTHHQILLFTFFFFPFHPSLLCTLPLFSALSQGYFKSVRTTSTLWYEGSEYEQESLVDVCACVLANFYLKGLEMFDSEMQD